jgi:hypothetical protein
MFISVLVQRFYIYMHKLIAHPIVDEVNCELYVIPASGIVSFAISKVFTVSHSRYQNMEKMLFFVLSTVLLHN